MHTCLLSWPRQGAPEFAGTRCIFADVVGSLEDEGAIAIRDPSSDEEERWITMGLDVLGKVLVVIYTWRHDGVRIISAGKAMPRERRQYEGANETRI